MEIPVEVILSQFGQNIPKFDDEPMRLESPFIEENNVKSMIKGEEIFNLNDGIELIEISYFDFNYYNSKKILRNSELDKIVIRKILKKYISE